MYRYLLIVSVGLFLFYSSPGFSQDDSQQQSQPQLQADEPYLLSPNSIYVEALGSGLFYSVNYDRLFSHNIGGRIGIGLLSDGLNSLYFIPVTLNYLIGKGNSKLELGAGVTIVAADIDLFGTGHRTSGSLVLGTAIIGYRYQPADGGFLFRIGFTPLFSEFGSLPWGGLSLGGTF
ncbi:MAG: hypothetical protein P4L27_14870 [Ignavibacteriaceae bacterium]|nr:hypothetical protein [Ignavibacteriaceae bacterium]